MCRGEYTANGDLNHKDEFVLREHEIITGYEQRKRKKEFEAGQEKQRQSVQSFVEQIREL